MAPEEPDDDSQWEEEDSVDWEAEMEKTVQDPEPFGAVEGGPPAKDAPGPDAGFAFEPTMTTDEFELVKKVSEEVSPPADPASIDGWKYEATMAMSEPVVVPEASVRFQLEARAAEQQRTASRTPLILGVALTIIAVVVVVLLIAL